MTQPTPTELRALEAVAIHGSITEAARELRCSPFTVRGHLVNVRQKLQAVTTVQAVYFAMRDGLLDPHDRVA